MKKLFAKLWDRISDPRLKLPLMIAILCLTLVLAGLALLSRGRAAAPSAAIPTQSAAAAAPAAPDGAPAPGTPIPASAAPTEPTVSPEPSETAQTPLFLRANSANRDLYIRVLNADGQPVTGQSFWLDVRFPGGASCGYPVGEDGSCYLVSLEPGEYEINLRPAEGYAQPAAVHCTVQAEARYEAIDDIDAVTEVVDVTEMSQDEVPADTSDAPEETVAEIIVEPAPEETVAEEVPVLDEEGRQVWSYSFPVGPNGYLLWSGTQEESNVFPVDEDGDQIPEYGLYLVEPEPGQDAETPEAQPYYVSVLLFNPDGTPVDTFEVMRVPVTETVEKKVGWQSEGGRDYFLYEDGSRAVGLKQIGGKLYYFDRSGVKASAVGIDVSFYNNGIDWQRVKAQGVDFVIIRVGGRGWTSGVLYDDCRTQEYLRGARAAGLRIGVYFYSTAVNPYEAVEEASVALKAVRGIPLDLPIFIDMEYSGEYPRGRADKLSPSERAEIAIAFCETIRNSGYQPGVYAGQNYMKAAIDYYAISRYTIWLASYTADNQLPNFDRNYDIWQFTDRGRVDGISGDVDMNVIF